MQALMLSLDRLVHRRRRVVLAVWLVALLAALPFAARQSESLTGGGFGVPARSPSASRTRWTATSTQATTPASRSS